MRGTIFTGCLRRDPSPRNLDSLAGELSDDVFLENASSHVTSCWFPTYTLTTYTSPFLSFRFPVSYPLSFLFLSSTSILS